MPTGYTASVGDGKVTEFNEFAMNCAKGMGVAIMMRDEPAGEKLSIEKCLDLSSIEHHKKNLAEAKKRLKRTDEEILADFDKMKKEKIKAAEEGAAREVETKRRYEAMLEKANAWTPPTKDHEGLKKFMVSQLTESIDFDCGGNYYERQLEDAKVLRPEVYLQSYRDSVERDVEYHTKQLAETEQRNAERRAWIVAFMESLGEPVQAGSC